MGCSVVVFIPNLSILNPFPIASILSFQGHASRNDIELSDKSDNQTPVRSKLLAGRAEVRNISLFHLFLLVKINSNFESYCRLERRWAIISGIVD